MMGAMAVPTTELRASRSLTWRWLQFGAAMVIGAAGVGSMITASVGVSPWDVFGTGLASTVGITVGTSTTLLGIALLVVAFALGERPGLGTVVTGLGFGPLVDLALGLLAEPPHLVPRALLFVLGFTLVAVAIVSMMDADVGIGPAETFTNAVCRRWGVSLAPARTGLELVLLSLGIALGGDLGVGTAAFAVGIGPAVAFGLHRLGQRRSLADALAHAGPV